MPCLKSSEPTDYHRLWDCPEPVEGECHCVPPRYDFDGTYALGDLDGIEFDGGRFAHEELRWVERANSPGFCLRAWYREMDEAHEKFGRKLEEIMFRESPMLALLRTKTDPVDDFKPPCGSAALIPYSIKVDIA